MSEDDGATPFGRLLRRWRDRRSVTQERLAYRADLSPRHVSFLETGRSNPSRESVLSLSRALDLPLRDRNALLRAAGFAAAYPERDPLADEENGHLRSLFRFLLERHEPCPAFVADRAWNVRMHNRAGLRLLCWLLEDEAGNGAEDGLAGLNLLRVLFDPDAVRPCTVNFDEVGRFLWDRLEERIALRPDDGELSELRRDLAELGPVPEGSSEPESALGEPALPIHLRKDGTDLRLLSFLMSVSAPREVGLQEIHIETFLPADGESEAVLREKCGT